jgi:hypothetical protein
MKGDYSAFIYFKEKKGGKLYRLSNTACLASFEQIQQARHGGKVPLVDESDEYNEKGYYELFNKLKESNTLDDSVVYIKVRDLEKESLKYLKRVVRLINKITPCSLYEREGILYVKYKYLPTYPQNLTLGNIIRMSYYQPWNLKYDGFLKSIAKRRRRGEDPLSFILKAVRENYQEEGKYSDGDHSLVYKNLKIRTAKQLIETEETSLQNFLTK